MDKNTSDSTIESTGVVIVGAGIAGLGAATKLEQSNFKDYILLEAQSYIGGRICSVPWNEGWIELGAQFFHGTGSELAQFAERRDLISDAHVAEGEGFYLREDGTKVDHKLVLEIDDVIKNVLEDCEKYATNNEIEYTDIDESIGKLLKTRFQKYLRMADDPPHIKTIKEELYDWNVRYLVIDNACEKLDDLSTKSWGKFKAVSGPEHNIFKTHYGSVVEALAEKLTQNNLRLNNTVIKIEWNEQVNSDSTKPITVLLQNDKIIIADCVIVTCSLGVLKENLDNLFYPALPTHMTQTIQSMGFGMINKVFLEFTEPWWESDTKGFQFLWKVRNLSQNDSCNNKEKCNLATWTQDLTGFDVLKDHPALLLGWVGRKGAQLLETLSEKQIIQDCATVFRYFLKDEKVPEASRCLKTCWGDNQFVRGGYCHITKKCDIIGVSPATLAEPVWGKIVSDTQNECLPILMLAGEATHEHYYSTTHGAYDSGVKQAKKFLQYHVTK